MKKVTIAALMMIALMLVACSHAADSNPSDALTAAPEPAGNPSDTPATPKSTGEPQNEAVATLGGLITISPNDVTELWHTKHHADGARDQCVLFGEDAVAAAKEILGFAVIPANGSVSEGNDVLQEYSITMTDGTLHSISFSSSHMTVDTVSTGYLMNEGEYAHGKGPFFSDEIPVKYFMSYQNAGSTEWVYDTYSGYDAAVADCVGHAANYNFFRYLRETLDPNTFSDIRKDYVRDKSSGISSYPITLYAKDRAAVEAVIAAYPREPLPVTLKPSQYSKTELERAKASIMAVVRGLPDQDKGQPIESSISADKLYFTGYRPLKAEDEAKIRAAITATGMESNIELKLNAVLNPD